MHDIHFGLRRMAVLAGALALCSAVGWLAPEVARAETAIAVDIEALVPVDPDEIDSGGGFGVRLGQQIHLPLVAITPELGFTWGSFGDGPDLYRGIAGLRLGVGELIRFGVSAHVGFGHMSFEAGPFETSHTAFTWDAGAFLDLTLLPLLDLGVHLAYTRLNGEDEPLGAPDVSWMAFGAHAALVF